MLNSVRIDKWLWAARVYKTRSMATEACNKGHVKIDGISVKPSRLVKPGDSLHIRRRGINESYQVVQCLDKRVGAKLIEQYRKDITAPEDKQHREILTRMKVAKRERGQGRPTKKERRETDKLKF